MSPEPPTDSIVDTVMSEFRWYRRIRGGVWFRVESMVSPYEPSMKFWTRERPASDRILITKMESW